MKTNVNNDIHASNGLTKSLVRYFPGWLVAYFALFAVVRVISRPNLEVDEAEMIYLTQWWFWGFGQQPPLYAWLQHALVEGIGYHILTVGLLRAALFGIILYGAYRIARLWGSKAEAVMSALWILGCTQFSIHSFRHTHTVLVTAMSVLTVLAWLRVIDRSSWPRYLWLGVCLGLGLLAKYNFVLVAGTILGISLINPRGRPKVVSPLILLTIGTALLLTAPHAFWLLNHQDGVSHSIRQDLSPEPLPYWPGLWSGVRSLLYHSFHFVFPVLLLGLFGTQGKPKLRISRPSTKLSPRLLTYFFAGNLFWLIVLLATGQTTIFSGRWLEPLFILFPLLLPGVWPLSTVRMLRLLTIWAGLLLLIHGVRFHVEGSLGETNRTHCSFRNLPLDDVDTLVGQSYFVAGNLKLHYPHKTILCDEGTAMESPPNKAVYVRETSSEWLPGEQGRRGRQTILWRNDCFTVYALFEKQ